MNCPHCRGENPEGQTVCVHCTLSLVADPASEVPLAGAAGDGAGIATVIPYKNPMALIAYYLGIFSLIPILGAVLGPAGFVLGILGLNRAKAHPESKGKVHAWTGILIGGLSALLHIAGIVLLIVLAAAEAFK